MTLPTQTVTGIIYYPDGTPMGGASITFTLDAVGNSVANGATIPPSMSTTTCDSSGVFTLGLWPNSLGDVLSKYSVGVSFAGNASGYYVQKIIGSIQVPNTTGPHNIADLLLANAVYPDAVYLGVITQEQYNSVMAADASASASATAAAASAVLAAQYDELWFDNVTALVASVTTFVDGKIVRIRDKGFSYRADSTATNGFVANSAATPQKFVPLPDSDGLISIEALGLMDGNDASLRLVSALDAGMTQLRFGSGIMKLNTPIIHSATQASIYGTPGLSIMDCSGGGGIDFDSGYTALPAMAADMALGASTVTFAAAHGLIVGDVFVLWNPTSFSFAPTQSTYRDGSMFKVAEVVNATTVRTFGTARDPYAASDMQCYKMNGGRIRMSGFGIIPPPSGIPLKVTWHQDVELDDIYCPSGSADTALSLTNCYDFNVTVESTVMAGNSYPVFIANSQKGNVTAGKHYSSRHCIAIGGGDHAGSVPPRDIQIHDMHLYNMDSGYEAADVHGGSDGIEYHNCIMDVSANPGGRNTGLFGCTIYGRSLADGNCILANEVDGGIYRIYNCRLVTSGNGASIGLIHFWPSYLSKDWVLDIKNLVIEHRNPATASSVRCLMLAQAVENDWDASAGAYPTIGLVDRKVYVVTVGGTIQGHVYIIGDRFMYSSSLPGFVNLRNDAKMHVNVDGLTYTGSDVFSIAKIGQLRDLNGLLTLSLRGIDAPNVTTTENKLVGASSSANYTVPMRLPEQTVTVPFTTSITTASAVSAAMVFKWAYPRQPSVILGLSHASAGYNPITTGHTMLNAFNVRATSLAMRIDRIDGANWGDVQTLIATAKVYIDDLS